MKTSRLHSSFLVAATFAVILLATAFAAPRAHAGDEPATIAFSDPAKPGTLRVSLRMGDVSVIGTDRSDVAVVTEFESASAPARKDGLRVISESATFSLVEKDNVVVLDSGDSWANFGSDAEFAIEVPRNTNVVIANGFGGEVQVTNIDGDIEIKSMNGEIDLDKVGGAVLVETMNGEISAKLTRLNAEKPISFTSMNGEIAIHVPDDAQAKVRLRTQNGAILTDFDEKSLVTKTEAVSGPRGSFNIKLSMDTDNEVRQAVREAVRVGVEAAREAAAAVREAAIAAREAAEEESRAAREARRAANEEAGHVAVIAPVPPVPPVPSVPTMTGGKLVSGALNGGNGPEIYAAAMNGDITLRKID